MRISRRLTINLGAIAVLAFVMVAWALSRLILSGGFEAPFTVTADFESSGGVFSNQEVTYRGVLVGRVGDLELNEDGIDIELVIDPEWKGRIPSDVAAKVQSKSAVGEQYVNLTPEPGASDDVLEQGDVIHRTRTELPVDFQQLLSSLDKVLGEVPPEQTRRVIEELAGGLAGREEEIATILESLGTLSDAFADVAPEQKRLLVNATRAGTEFVRTKDAFADAIRAADEVFAGIGDEPEELSRLFRSNDAFARAGIRLLAKHGGNLRSGIAALADFVHFQLEEKEGIKGSLQYVPQFLHAVEDASIPWRSPDGRTFYRIRIGLIVDNEPSSWPCKYRVPDDYERFPHERTRRTPVTTTNCLPPTSQEAAASSLLAALTDWADENTDALLAPAPAAAADAPAFGWPLWGPITSDFGPRDGKMHTGIDIGGTEGDPVRIAAPGRVVLAGTYGDYGETVIVDHGDGFMTLYGHLSSVSVAAGDVLSGGEVLGAVGCTGECSGDHLHFEILIDGVPVDPLPYLPGGPLFAYGWRA